MIVVGFAELRKENLTLCETYEKKVKLKLTQMFDEDSAAAGHHIDNDDGVYVAVVVASMIIH